MKKIFLIFVTIFSFSASYSSDTIDIAELPESDEITFSKYLRMGKKEFSKEFDDQDFKIAVENLEKAVKIKPNDMEALYFLGSAYDRLNSKDGSTINNMKLTLTIKASEQFEKINKLSPKYDGEELILDPYSKLSSVWGSQALCYMANNKPDSAIWACEEGKKRGGFSDYWLCANRKMLDNCPKNALFFVTGDTHAFNLLYLQQKEEYRTDVAMIILPFFNTVWYPKMMEEKKIIDFGITHAERDSLDYCYTNGDSFSIPYRKSKKFSWEPTGYSSKYLLRGDRLFLELLENNKFNREVFFPVGIDPAFLLGLDEISENCTNVSRVNYNNTVSLTVKEYEKKLMNNMDCFEYLNENSTQEIIDLRRTRYYVLERIKKYTEENRAKEAEYLLNIFDKYLLSEEYESLSDNETEFYDYLKQKIKSWTKH